MSPRARTALIVAALAALAAVVVAGASVISSDERDSGAATTVAPKPRKGAPPLELSLGVRDDAEAPELRRAVRLYEAGRRSQAGAIFNRYGSLEAKLGAAFAAWPGPTAGSSSSARSTLAARSSSCTSGSLASGPATGEAGTAWREARDVEPDTPYAVCGGRLHPPELAPGLPVFIAELRLPRPRAAHRRRQLAALEPTARRPRRY